MKLALTHSLAALMGAMLILFMTALAQFTADEPTRASDTVTAPTLTAYSYGEAVDQCMTLDVELWGDCIEAASNTDW